MENGSKVAAGVVAARYRADPLTAKLATVIRSLGPGGKLPSERDLATELGVSRTALRDRLQLLEALGVLRRAVGSGTFIQRIEPSGLAMGLHIALTASQLDLSALHSVRVALERQAAIEATLFQDPVLIAYLRKAADRMSLAEDDDALDEADVEFHHTLVQAADNPALTFFAAALAGVIQEALAGRRAGLRRLAGERELMIDVHERIYQAVASGDPAAAAAAVDGHFAAFDQAMAEIARQEREGNAPSAAARR
ncbi:FadR/GntR family transcriptional regulator [Amycolatopsis sp. H20-H5]|uniref:FadR/GntR family transcriptional regulator n=1 Tax=Amycolatopsis sp. H20-H5 TaxID=3046309 RepID=UPI002DBB0B1B|nr:FCD domain-containing protein [Amycolatopsis sp. H20-H5]MEC3976601.1 FCD domain-containing protein [Amycolatopsis sp. H20-H5]